MDRNEAVIETASLFRVALRKESVDRNTCWMSTTPSRAPVALRKESVDRNSKTALKRGGYAVALRKESVDRNRYGALAMYTPPRSLSARRAWIEIAA